MPTWKAPIIAVVIISASFLSDAVPPPPPPPQEPSQPQAQPLSRSQLQSHSRFQLQIQTQTNSLSHDQPPPLSDQPQLQSQPPPLSDQPQLQSQPPSESQQQPPPTDGSQPPSQSQQQPDPTDGSQPPSQSQQQQPAPTAVPPAPQQEAAGPTNNASWPPSAPRSRRSPSNMTAARERKRMMETQAREFILAHNVVRAHYREPPLKWDRTLAKYTRRFAQKRIAECDMIHSKGPYGENIFWGGRNHWTPTDVVEIWAKEHKYFRRDTNDCEEGKKCGHYTQIVWRDTLRLGCARVNCDNGGMYAICSYDPPGNYAGLSPFISHPETAWDYDPGPGPDSEPDSDSPPPPSTDPPSSPTTT